MLQDNPTVARLKARLAPERPAIAMAAHNPLAAKLAAAAGFDAIWGSGYSNCPPPTLCPTPTFCRSRSRQYALARCPVCTERSPVSRLPARRSFGHR
jgi:hypothetical protein